MATRKINLAAIAASIKSASTPAPLKKGLIKKYGKQLGLTQAEINKYLKASGAAKKVAKKVKAKKSKNPKGYFPGRITKADKETIARRRADESSARWTAIGVITGGKVDQLEARGFEVFWKDKAPGKLTDAQRWDAVGILSGGKASMLDEAGLTVRKTKKKAKSNPPWDGKTPWRMTQAEWSKIHRDYKSDPGKPKRALALDPKTGGTTSVPVEIIKAGGKKFKPGDKVSYDGYPGTVMRHYSGNIYEVRLASGDIAVDASNLVRITEREWLDTPRGEKVKGKGSALYIVTGKVHARGMRDTISKPMSKARAEAFKKGLEADLKIAAPQYKWVSELKIQKANPAKHSTGKYKRTRLASPKKFDPRSFRTKKVSKKVKLIVGCPEGEYMPRKKKCKVGTKAQAKLTKKNPPASTGTVIYDRITAIEARKGKGSLWPGEDFRHDFKEGGRIVGLPNGDLLVKKPKSGKKLWKNFEYGPNDGTRKNPARKASIKSKHYIGIKRNKPVKIHSLKNPPTKARYPQYTTMVGPFSSKKAAQEYAANN